MTAKWRKTRHATDMIVILTLSEFYGVYKGKFVGRVSEHSYHNGTYENIRFKNTALTGYGCDKNATRTERFIIKHYSSSSVAMADTYITLRLPVFSLTLMIVFAMWL